MSKENPKLLIEINEANYIFVVGDVDENDVFTVNEKRIVNNTSFSKDKLTDLDKAKQIIRENVESIENKLNCIFNEAIVIIDNFYCLPVNVSGFKKLNGSQILKENISFILNSTKLAVSENEKDKTIIHIFNAKSVLDKTIVDNLPIGLFGDFYNHELSFFLIKNNDLKNIQQIFTEANINVKKIFIKSFVEGAQLIERNKEEDTFFMLKINKLSSQISYFEKSSLRFIENFFFGSDFIYKDVEKVCSLKKEIVNDFFLKNSVETTLENKNKNELLEKDYFKNISFRKIRKELMFDVANARLEEILNIIFIKNINLNLSKKSIQKIFVFVEDISMRDLFRSYFNNSSSIKNINLKAVFTDEITFDSLVNNALSLSKYGWKKEAVPKTQTKNSIITKIFKYFFS